MSSSFATTPWSCPELTESEPDPFTVRSSREKSVLSSVLPSSSEAAPVAESSLSDPSARVRKTLSAERT